VLAAQIRRLHPNLMLLQYPDDLLFRVAALLHRPSSRLDYEKTPALTGRNFREQVTTCDSRNFSIQLSHEFLLSRSPERLRYF
jgi:hypothetical protein